MAKRDEQLASFPFSELPQTIIQFITQLSGYMQEHNISMQTIGGDIVIVPGDGSPSANILALPDGEIRATIKLNPLAKFSPAVKEWLGKYHQQFQAKELTPNIYKCDISVTVYGGQVSFYLTYIMTHKDGSLAHESPQGRLMTTLSAGSLIAKSGTKQVAQPTEKADWL